MNSRGAERHHTLKSPTYYASDVLARLSAHVQEINSNRHIPKRTDEIFLLVDIVIAAFKGTSPKTIWQTYREARKNANRLPKST